MAEWIALSEVAVRPSRAQDAVRAVFSKGGACYDCHTIFAPQAGNSWRVAAVNQTARYLQKGWFDHDAHRETDCADCHQRQSQTIIATQKFKTLWHLLHQHRRFGRVSARIF